MRHQRKARARPSVLVRVWRSSTAHTLTCGDFLSRPQTSSACGPSRARAARRTLSARFAGTESHAAVCASARLGAAVPKRSGRSAAGATAQQFLAALPQASPIPPFSFYSVLLISSLLSLPLPPKPHFSVATPSFLSSLIEVLLSESLSHGVLTFLLSLLSLFSRLSYPLFPSS